MKKAFFSVILMAFVLVSCNQKNKEATTQNSDMMDNDTTEIAVDTSKTETQQAVSSLYACPMHPEEQGDLDDECSKCGMKLSEPVQ